jgi:hypothetical protein
MVQVAGDLCWRQSRPARFWEQFTDKKRTVRPQNQTKGQKP